MSTLNPAADLEKAERSTSVLDLGDALDSKDLPSITVALRKGTRLMVLAIRGLGEEEHAPLDEDFAILIELANGISLMAQEVSRLYGDLCKE